MALGALLRNRLPLRSRRHRLLPHRISHPFLCCSAMRRAMSIGRAIGRYTLGSLSALGVNASGEIYVVDIDNGNVFKITLGR